MFRKAQAAMEFLMTYGWALLAVLIVIGALAYLGVLDPTILIPERCTIAAPLNCEDFVVTVDADRAHGDPDPTVTDDNVEGVELLLRNGGGKGLHIKSIETSSDAFPIESGDENYKCAWVNPSGAGNIFLLKAGTQKKFSLTDLNGPVDLNGDGDAVDAAATAFTPIDVFDFNNDGTDTPLDETVVTQENGCPYNDVGSPKNRYDIIIKYSLANSPTITHTLNGEMFASEPAS